MGDLPEPPYPPETKANGYKVEFDIRRIKASKTWLLAREEVRNVLLRLWLETWELVPCGSLEDDDDMIAALTGVSREWLHGHREQLMRGWQMHSDGRLYHPFITGMVLEMLRRRRGATERMAKSRERAKSRDVTRNTPKPDATYAQEQEQEQEQDISTDLPNGRLVTQQAASPPPARQNANQTPKPNTDEIAQVLAHLNAKTGSQFQTRNNTGKLTANAKLVQARIAEHGQQALIAVIDAKTKAWINDPKMRDYLRPETLFGARKCEQYVGQLTAQARSPLDGWAERMQGTHTTINGEFSHDPE